MWLYCLFFFQFKLLMPILKINLVHNIRDSFFLRQYRLLAEAKSTMTKNKESGSVDIKCKLKWLTPNLNRSYELILWLIITSHKTSKEDTREHSPASWTCRSLRSEKRPPSSAARGSVKLIGWRSNYFDSVKQYLILGIIQFWKSISILFC